MAITRQITGDEVDHFRSHGWVVLRRWVDLAAVAEAFEICRSAMGDDAQNPMPSVVPESVRMWRRWDAPWKLYPELEKLGRSAEFTEPLTALPFSDDGLRFWHDQFAVKTPDSIGTTTETPWHQDNPYLAIDRVGDLTVWVALHDMTPEHGTMRFLTGSHTLGPLEDTFLDGQSGDLRDRHPDLWEKYELSSPLTLAAGDATVHDGCTIHWAPNNTAAEPRRAYISEYIPGASKVARLPNGRVEALGLREGDDYPDDDSFPLTRRPAVRS